MNLIGITYKECNYNTQHVIHMVDTIIIIDSTRLKSTA